METPLLQTWYLGCVGCERRTLFCQARRQSKCTHSLEPLQRHGATSSPRLMKQNRHKDSAAPVSSSPAPPPPPVPPLSPRGPPPKSSRQMAFLRLKAWEAAARRRRSAAVALNEPMAFDSSCIKLCRPTSSAAKKVEHATRCTCHRSHKRAQRVHTV